MATGKVYKPKVHVVLDIETLSTDKRAAIVELAAVVAMGSEATTFHVKIKPTSNRDAGLDIDQATIDWHEKIHPGYLANTETKGLSLQEAMASFCDWLAPYAANFELHMWSQGKDFDFPIADYAIKLCGLKSPWAYSRVHCLRDLVWLNPGARIKERPADLPQHEALNDALFETAQLRAVVLNNDWFRRLFK